MLSTWPCSYWLVNSDCEVSTFSRILRQTNLRLALRSRMPGSSPASVMIWKPLHTPMTAMPLSARAFTSRRIGEWAAMAPQRR